MIFFLMGVSGSGKTTLLNASGVLDDERFVYIPSYTTRPMRAGEINGMKYRHISVSEFEDAIENHEFLEYALVHGTSFYGTKAMPVLSALDQHRSPIKEIEVQGLLRIKEDGRIEGKYTTIFLDIDEITMRERFMTRQTVDEDDISNRIKSSLLEREVANKYCDYIIDATQPLDSVVHAFWQIVNKVLT